MIIIKRKKNIEADAKLGRELFSVVAPYAGERGQAEGTVETVQRVIAERNKALEKIGDYYLQAKAAFRIAALSIIMMILAGVALYILCRRLDDQVTT